MTTGFDPVRAIPHERAVELVVTQLKKRGYKPETLPPKGNEPDIKIVDRDGGIAYIDVKTFGSHQNNFSIKHGALVEYVRLSLTQKPVYVVWIKPDRVTVDSVFTLQARVIAGPRRPTGNGSNTDFILVSPGGTQFSEFFPNKEAAA